MLFCCLNQQRLDALECFGGFSWTFLKIPKVSVILNLSNSYRFLWDLGRWYRFQRYPHYTIMLPLSRWRKRSSNLIAQSTINQKPSDPMYHETRRVSPRAPHTAARAKPMPWNPPGSLAAFTGCQIGRGPDSSLSCLFILTHPRLSVSNPSSPSGPKATPDLLDTSRPLKQMAFEKKALFKVERNIRNYIKLCVIVF